MPVTKEDERLTQETIETLQEGIQDITQPVRISPKRMLAFQNMIKMRTTVTINGVAVQLVEDKLAPALKTAIADASPGAAARMKALQVRAGDPCGRCGGATVVRSDGAWRCLDCGILSTHESLPSDSPVPFKPTEPDAPNAPSKVVLASERHLKGEN